MIVEEEIEQLFKIENDSFMIKEYKESTMAEDDDESISVKIFRKMENNERVSISFVSVCERYVACGTYKGETLIFDHFENSSAILPSPSTTTNLTCIAFTQDGNRIITAYNTGLITLWDCNGSKIKDCDFHSKSILCLKVMASDKGGTGKVECLSADSSGRVLLLSFNRLALWWSVDSSNISSGKDGILLNMESLPSSDEMSTLTALNFSASTFVISTSPATKLLFKWFFPSPVEYSSSSWNKGFELSSKTLPSLARSFGLSLQVLSLITLDGGLKEWGVVEETKFERTILFVTWLDSSSVLLILENSLEIVVWNYISKTLSLRSNAIAASGLVFNSPSLSTTSNSLNFMRSGNKIFINNSTQIRIVTVFSLFARLERKLDSTNLGKKGALCFVMNNYYGLYNPLSEAKKKSLKIRLTGILDCFVREELSKSKEENDVNELFSFCLAFCTKNNDMDYIYTSLFSLLCSFHLEAFFIVNLVNFELSRIKFSNAATLSLPFSLISSCVTYLSSLAHFKDKGEKLLIANNWKGGSISEKEIASLCIANNYIIALCIIIPRDFQNLILPLENLFIYILMHEKQSVKVLSLVIYYIRNMLLDPTLMLFSQHSKIASIQYTDLANKLFECFSLFYGDANGLGLLINHFPLETLSLLQDLWLAKFQVPTMNKEIIEQLSKGIEVENFMSFLVTVCVIDKSLAIEEISQPYAFLLLKNLVGSNNELIRREDVIKLIMYVRVEGQKNEDDLFHLLEKNGYLETCFSILEEKGDYDGLLSLFRAAKVQDKKMVIEKIVTSLSKTNDLSNPLNYLVLNNLLLFVDFDFQICKDLLEIMCQKNLDAVSAFLMSSTNLSNTSLMKLVMKRSQSDFPSPVHLKYINLLYNDSSRRDEVMEYLVTRKDYPVDEILEICILNNDYESVAYLYDRIGNALASLQFLASLLKEKQNNDRYTQILKHCLRFCLSNWKNEEMWNFLFVRVKEFENSLQQSEIRESMSPLQNVIKEIYENIIQHLTLDNLLPELNEKSSSIFIQRYFLSLLIEKSKNQMQRTNSIFNILHADLREFEIKKKQEEGRGLVAQNNLCLICMQLLNDELILNEFNRIIVFGCQHAFHVDCLPLKSCLICRPDGSLSRSYSFASDRLLSSSNPNIDDLKISSQQEQKRMLQRYDRFSKATRNDQSLFDSYDDVALLMENEAFNMCIRSNPRTLKKRKEKIKNDKPVIGFLEMTNEL